MGSLEIVFSQCRATTSLTNDTRTVKGVKVAEEYERSWALWEDEGKGVPNMGRKGARDISAHV